LIEGHSHLLLHPYDRASWTDQVLVESHGERTIRGVNHALAEYADVSLIAAGKWADLILL